MEIQKVREAIAVYRKKFEELEIKKSRLPSADIVPLTDAEFFGHCYWMLDEIGKMLDEGKMDKVFRWLGFVQGCLWRASVYTIEDMKDHNRP